MTGAADEQLNHVPILCAIGNASGSSGQARQAGDAPLAQAMGQHCADVCGGGREKKVEDRDEQTTADNGLG